MLRLPRLAARKVALSPFHSGGCFDLDHIGAEVPQQHGAVGAREIPGQVENGDTGEGVRR